MSARKKQKGESGQPINVGLASDEDALGPAFGLFPAAKPPATTPYSVYSTSGKLADGHNVPANVLAAETPDMEYDSRNHMGAGTGGGDGQVSGEGQGYSVQYMLGVHNPRTNTLTLHSAPLHTFSTSIKALKAAPGTLTSSQFSVQKALLGTTFGTRKAIRAINTQARNKLDESSFGTGTASLQAHLQSSIAASTTSLPTADAIEHAANVSRPIPPPNFDATKPGDVYALDKVVSDAELTLVDIAALIRATQVADRNRLLPFRRSKFITNRMREILPNRGDEEDEPTLKSNDRLRLRILVHLSHMFAFRQATMGGGREINVTKLKERFGETVDEAAIVALVERFSETHKTGGGGEERRVTGVTEVKLLGYLLVLVLKVDGWSTDVTTIAADLGMGAQKVQELFKSLGCAIMTPSADERQKLISSGAATTDAEARKRKRAVLKVPLEFPKERRGVPKR